MCVLEDQNVRYEFNGYINDWEKGKLTAKQIAKMCNISEATFYRRLREMRSENE